MSSVICIAHQTLNHTYFKIGEIFPQLNAQENRDRGIHKMFGNKMPLYFFGYGDSTLFKQWENSNAVFIIAHRVTEISK